MCQEAARTVSGHHGPWARSTLEASSTRLIVPGPPTGLALGPRRVLMKLLGRYPLALAVLLCAICLGESRAGLVDSITFDEPQLVDNDPLLQFYNGGTTFRGIGG